MRAILLAAMLAITTPASASIYSATFTGQFYNAGDFAGLFGPAGVSLNGQSFSATYRVDTGASGIVAFSAGNSHFYYSG